MSPSLLRKLVNATLLLGPILAALVAAAAVRANPGKYTLGGEQSATATITDASGSAAARRSRAFSGDARGSVDTNGAGVHEAAVSCLRSGPPPSVPTDGEP
jgi:hypothetical protein